MSTPCWFPRVVCSSKLAKKLGAQRFEIGMTVPPGHLMFRTKDGARWVMPVQLDDWVL